MSVQGNSSDEEVIVFDPNSEGMFVVESIIDKKETADGTNVQYLIKWKGYEESESTWEPRANLHESCNHLISQFEYKYATTKRFMNKRSSEEDQNPEIAEKKVCKTARKKLSALIVNDNPKPSSSAATFNADDSDDSDDIKILPKITGAMGSSKSINENSKLGNSDDSDDSDDIEILPKITGVMGSSKSINENSKLGDSDDSDDSDDIEILPKITGVMGSSKSINENSKLGESSAGVTAGGFTPFTAVMGESSKVKGNVCDLAGKRNKEAPQSCPSTPMTTEIPGEIEFLEEVCTIGETETPETATPTILARGKVNGRRTFFLKFPNTGNVVMMPVEEAKIEWPQAVIEFYETKYELLCRFVPEQEY